MIPTLYEPFRHWSEKGSVYILSDLHFDDADCKFMSPDWITPQEQIAIIAETTTDKALAGMDKDASSLNLLKMRQDVLSSEKKTEKPTIIVIPEALFFKEEET